MRIPGVKTVKAISRWAQARLLGGAMILGYHRVANVGSDEYEVCVSPEHFSEQMQVIRKYANPISMSRLVQHLGDGSVPAGSVAVTFDDGYADNLYQAKPILEKYNVPATVFVCTGFAGKEFWWDELERIVMCSNAEPEGLHLQVGKHQFGRHALGAGPEANTDLSHRRKLRQALYNLLLLLDVDDRERSMETIRIWAGSLSAASAEHRAMDPTELMQLAQGGLIEIGSHTRSHPMLPHLPLTRQAEEITSGKQELENLLGRPVTGFAYPNGKATQDAKRYVKEAGFSYACTSLHDMVRPGDDLFELTRFWQKDVDGERFLQSLQVWMNVKKTYA